MAFREGVLVFNQAGALPAAALAELAESVRKIDVEQIRKTTAPRIERVAKEN